MYRKMLTGALSLTLLGVFFAPQGRADEGDKKTIITTNESIQVPGKVLPAGTYELKLINPDDLTLVGIYNGDGSHLIATVQGISDSRMEPTGKSVLQFEERPAGQPEALKEWFYPGDDSGVEFIYPTQAR